jgi:hypothetical protein
MREAKTGWPSVGLAPMTRIDVGVLDRVEILRAGRGAEGLAEAVAGRRMADAGAGIDIVVAEAGADQLLHQIGLFVGAARRGDAADRRSRPCFSWMRRNSEATRPIASSQLTSRQGSVDLLADHRLEDAVRDGSIAPGEAALDAGMAAIGLAVLPGHHAHELLAAHLGLEVAADAAIGAGRDHRMLGLADLDDRLFRTASPSGRPARRRRRRRIRSSGNRSACRATRGESKPRPSIVSAKVPCTSSQARTQREQTMHLDGSKVKYGFDLVLLKRALVCRLRVTWLSPS